jgi:hypothetical protein
MASEPPRVIVTALPEPWGTLLEEAVNAAFSESETHGLHWFSCETLVCARNLAERRSADFVVGGKVTTGEHGSSYRLRTWVFDRATPTVFRRDYERECQHCTEAEATQVFRELSRAAAENLRPQPPPTRFKHPEFCNDSACAPRAHEARKIILLPMQVRGLVSDPLGGRDYTDFLVAARIRRSGELVLREWRQNAAENRCRQFECMGDIAARYGVALVLHARVEPIQPHDSFALAGIMGTVMMFDQRAGAGSVRVGRCPQCRPCDKGIFLANLVMATIAGEPQPADEIEPLLSYPEAEELTKSERSSLPLSVGEDSAHSSAIVVGVKLQGWFGERHSWQAEYRLALEQAMKEEGYVLRSRAAIDHVERSCLEKGCMASIARRLNVARVIAALVENDELLPPSHEFRVLTYDRIRDRYAQARQLCRNCSERDVAMLLAPLLARVLRDERDGIEETHPDSAVEVDIRSDRR